MTFRKKTKRRTSPGAEVVAGLSELRDALESGAPIDQSFTVRTVELDLVPKEYDASTVRETRQMLRMSQAIFAVFLGVEAKTVQSWEQGTRKPSSMARRFMDEIRHNPRYWMKRFREEAG